VDSDGDIYFTSTDGNLYALYSSGAEKWRQHTGGATGSSPVLDKNGEIYLAANQFDIGVSRDGKELWEYGAADLIDASPAVAANGTIYFSQPWRSFIALTPDGKLQWEFLEDARINSSPVIGGDGTVYFNFGRDLIALVSTNAAPLAKNSWPMWRANPQHTGRVQTVK
jgi:outer membrane protein assembly factor BamB